MLRARLYGGLSVQVDGRPVADLGGTRPRSLLAYLLLHPGRHPRTRLAGTFWPDVLETSARGSLRSALWAVRAALETAGGGGHLVADRAGVGIEGEVEVDALAVDALLSAGDPASLQRAVALADGPVLPDLADEWALAAQERDRERITDALLALADAAEGRGDREGAVALTRRALARDRLRESTHRALMRRLAVAGDRAGALAVHRRCTRILAAELGVPPAPETRRLAEEIRAGDLAAGEARPAPRPGPPRRSPPPALVGRTADLARLERAWAGAASGAGGVVLISGVAGVGKSRLAQELGERAAAVGALTATGGASGIEGGPPFGVWTDVLRGLVRGVPAPDAASGWPGEIARLCPAAERAWGIGPGPPAQEPGLGRTRLFEAVAELVERAAGAAPCLVLLEDLHAADPESLALLAHVGGRLPELPVLVVATARTRVATAALDRVRLALGRRGAMVDDIPLRALGDGEVAAIARAAAPALPDAAVAGVVDVARGNPLLAMRAAHAAAAGDDPGRALLDAVRAALADLSPEAAALVAAAAVAGRPLGAAETAALAGGRVAEQALAEAAAADLLDADAAPGAAFVHDLVRDACAAALPAANRRAAHARLADVLAGNVPGGRGAAEIAHHLRRAGDPDRARAFLFAAAASARALGALDRAAEHLRDAAASAAETADPAAEGEAWIAVAEVEAWRGDRAALDEAFARGRATLEAAGDAVGLASALAERGRWFRTTTCYPAEVYRSGQEALELLGRAGADAPETRLIALSGMAWGEAVGGDPARAAALHERVGLMLEADGDPVLRAEHLSARGISLLRGGDPEAAAEAFAAAAGLADATGRAAHALDARLGQAMCHAVRGRLDATLAVLGDPPDPARTGPSLACQQWAARAHALSRLGRHAEAEAAAREQVALARRAGGADFRAIAEGDLGTVLLAAGDAAGALAAFEEALADPGARVPRASLRLQAAEAAVTAGAVAEARRHLDAFRFEPVRPRDTPATLPARVDRVSGLLRLVGGDIPGAIADLDAAAERWRELARRAEPAGGVSDAIAGSLIDLGRPPVAGLTDVAAELARAERDLAKARAVAATAAAGRG